MPTKTKAKKLYDVAIIEVHDGEIKSIIGRQLDEAQADQRLLTGLSRINASHFVDILPAGKYTVGDYTGGM